MHGPPPSLRAAVSRAAIQRVAAKDWIAYSPVAHAMTDSVDKGLESQFRPILARCFECGIQGAFTRQAIIGLLARAL